MAFGTVKENLQQRLSDLRKFLKVATEGGNIDFARSTLGQSLFVFMEVSITVDINAASHQKNKFCSWQGHREILQTADLGVKEK